MSNPSVVTRVVRWIDYRLPVFTLVQHELVDFPEPKNLNYWWNMGSLAGIMLVVQMITGIVLAMYYTPDAALAFDSVERIMRDVNHGWMIRYIHMNGSSMFFALVYIHLFRGLYYGSYKNPRELLWLIGVLILGLMMATAFTGYVLPWGQLSFWAATVITQVFSAVPVAGTEIVEWLWGAFAVDNATLKRFYSFHYLLPFIIVAAVLAHLVALHMHGSNNPLGIDPKSPEDKVPFHPYYTVKDMVGLGVFFMIFAFFVFFAPNSLGEPINYIPANPMVTPEHIVPEWYFLPYYAILRSFDFDIWFLSAKLLGVIAMFASIIVLFLVPWLDTSKVRSAKFRPIYKQVFWILVIDCLILGVVGAHAPNAPVFSSIEGFLYIHLGQIATFYYFLHFIVLMPLIGWFERPKPLPRSISEPVLTEKA